MSIVSRAVTLAKRSFAMDRNGRSSFDKLASAQPAVYPALVAGRLPHYRDPSPMQRIPHQRQLRKIVRHLARTDARVKTITDTKLEIVVGCGPKPKSRFRELADLFMETSGQFDNRGDRTWGMFVDDIARLLFEDGEAFVRVRDREDRPFWSDITVPVQFQILPCDMVPDDYEGPYDAQTRFTAGVAIRNDRKLAYAVWTEHPVDGWQLGRVPKLVMLPADQIFQVTLGSLGNPRGEVPLSSAILPAEDLADLSEADIQHRKNSAAMATFFEQPADRLEAGGNIGVEDDERSSAEEMVRNLHLRPGDSLLLPPGYKANIQTPTGGAPGHDISVKGLTMVICAVAGVPYFDAMGDWKEAPERAMRYAGAALKRRVLRDRAVLERILDQIWRAFVVKAMTTGKWRPPAGATTDEIFKVSWSWPVVQQAALDRELTMMLAMVKAGMYPPSRFLEDYFGIDLEEAARQWAEDAARLRALGIKTLDAEWTPDVSTIAGQILATVTAEEQHERDLVEASKRDTSVLRSPAH